MFVVAHAAAVPDHLKGYVDRFLVEVSPSLYVGTLTRRVAEELWNSLVEHRVEGHITFVVSSSSTEQGYEVWVEGRDDVAIRDFDGLALPAWSRKVADHAH